MIVVLWCRIVCATLKLVASFDDDSIVTLLIDRGGNGPFDVKKEALLTCSIQIISIVPNFLPRYLSKNFCSKR